MIPFCLMNPQTVSSHAEPARCAGGDLKSFSILKIFIGGRADPIAFNRNSGDAMTESDTKKRDSFTLSLITLFYNSLVSPNKQKIK